MEQIVMAESLVLENQSLEGLELGRRADPFGMVIYGAHGDLTKRKLIPALFSLHLQNLLPKDFFIIGASRTALSDEQFRSSMRQAILDFASDIKVEGNSWDQFATSLYYRPANTADPQAYKQLSSTLDELDRKHGTLGNRIYYLSTPPSLYSEIIAGLASAGLAFKSKINQAPWSRIVIEKPFGHDLKSSEALDAQIHEVFNEHQIFRIDHYLGKETVQNIMVLRFANGIFEPLWNHKYVEHVQITNAETLGVEGRGTYYEEAGALRDMIQNHLLQLVSLVGMEPPISLEPEAIRDEKVKLLKTLRPIEVERVGQLAVRGQYGPGYISGQAVPGYRQESGVSPQSMTETFAAIKLFIDNWRWADVPFYIRSGKRLAKSITEIAIHFRRAPHRLFSAQAGSCGALSPNVLVMQIQPEEGISLKFATKQPGQTTQIRWLNMDFKYGAAFGVRSPSAYERLIHDCLLGDPSLFARTDQVDISWSIIEPIMEAWEKGNAQNSPPLLNYAAGSWGPEASDNLICADGYSWRRL